MLLHHTFEGIIVLIYVDGIIIIGMDAATIQHLQASHKDSFHMNDLGPFTYLFGLEVNQSSKGLILYYHKYALVLIDITRLKNSTPVYSLIEMSSFIKTMVTLVLILH